LTPDEIRRLLSDSQRKKAREIWGPNRVKDQDGIGACQGYASASAVEKARELSGQPYVELSGDFAYSLVNGGRDRGSLLIDGFRAAQKYGYAPANTPGLVRWEYRRDRMPAAAFTAAKAFRGFEGFTCDTQQQFASAIALGFVGVVAVHVSGNYSRMDSNGISLGGNGVGNHAVCVDDIVWDANLGDFKYDSPNSWKRTWGVEGRAYYTFERHFRETIRRHKFYVFPTASIDSGADNPPPLRIA